MFWRGMDYHSSVGENLNEIQDNATWLRQLRQPQFLTPCFPMARPFAQIALGHPLARSNTQTQTKIHVHFSETVNWQTNPPAMGERGQRESTRWTIPLTTGR
jgi:hypothetical protein